MLVPYESSAPENHLVQGYVARVKRNTISNGNSQIKLMYDRPRYTDLRVSLFPAVY